MFTGFRIAAGLAVVGAIIGEYFFRVGEQGLGQLLDKYTKQRHVGLPAALRHHRRLLRARGRDVPGLRWLGRRVAPGTPPTNPCSADHPHRPAIWAAHVLIRRSGRGRSRIREPPRPDAISGRPADWRHGSVSARERRAISRSGGCRAAECELLEYAAPLTLARREYRFIIGTWRPSKTYVVIQHPDRVVMTCTRQELEERGIAVP